MFKTILLIYLALCGISSVMTIGKYRAPITREGAVFSLAVLGLISYGLLNWI